MNSSNRNWTAFEIELRLRPNDPSREDGLSFGKIFVSPDNPFLGYDLVIPSPLTGSDCAAARTFPCSDRFNKLTLLRYPEPVTGQTWLKDVLRFSSGSVRPGQSVTFTFFITQLDALNPNFHIIQRPNPGPSTQ